MVLVPPPISGSGTGRRLPDDDGGPGQPGAGRTAKGRVRWRSSGPAPGQSGLQRPGHHLQRPQPPALSGHRPDQGRVPGIPLIKRLRHPPGLPGFDVLSICSTSSTRCSRSTSRPTRRTACSPRISRASTSGISRGEMVPLGTLLEGQPGSWVRNWSPATISIRRPPSSGRRPRASAPARPSN